MSVKYGGLEKILPWIETMTDSHTVVMSLLNGVDSEEIIGKRIGMEHMVYSLMKIASQRTGNQIRYDPRRRQEFSSAREEVLCQGRAG